MQKTFAMIKPDALARRLSGLLLARIEAAKFKLIQIEQRFLSENFIKEFYKEHLNAPFFPNIVERLANQSVIGLVVEGEQAVLRFRQLIGATNPAQAAPGTLRADYGIDLDQNTVHGSDSEASAQREMTLFFGDRLRAS